MKHLSLLLLLPCAAALTLAGCLPTIPGVDETMVGAWEVDMQSGSLASGMQVAGINSMEFQFNEDGTGYQKTNGRQQDFEWEITEENGTSRVVTLVYDTEPYDANVVELSPGGGPATLGIKMNNSSGTLKRKS